ncbi:MAG: hypothetical protein IT381_06340 [Deltaproteobacteria bacterium]|nr:hypothetical protein [Deltaproteobacteria bacterium]
MYTSLLLALHLAAPMNTAALKKDLVAKHGAAHEARITKGVDQLAALWRKDDGDLAAFAKEHFIADPKQLDATFERFEQILEQTDGHLLEIGRELRRATELDIGPLLPVDPLFSAFDPSSHLTDDLFQTKIAFVVLLNFPLTTLAERLQNAERYSRRQWAETRLANRFARRVPAEILQRNADAGAKASLYIDEYNIWMHHVLGEDGARLFPKNKKLISHWNLRDELKSAYADKENGLKKQRAIAKVMERIVTQTIPLAVIDNPRADWDPWKNAVSESKVLDDNAPKDPKAVKLSAEPEPATRYAHLLNVMRAAKEIDPYSPQTPSAIQRSFELGRELPEARVKALLEAVLAAPIVPKIAAEIEKRLGRKLEPFDLWYDGFKARAAIDEAELDKKTKQRYPSADAFKRDIPRILEALGFGKVRAQWIADRIVVDPSRGAGHAMPAARRGDFPHLRTRVEKDGMNYKGYNIAVHELGHNVEQVVSLYDIDHTLLAGVPNSAFTEALAFVFQSRDLDLLSVKAPKDDGAKALNDFWAAWEIAGVGLVDVAVWHWMYDHPKATAPELRDATVKISKEIWDRYYAPVLGGKGATTLLGIYSHMIAYPLYVIDYPIGHMIEAQLEAHLAKATALGVEFERVAKTGSIAPDLWMQAATGAPVSAEPLIRAAERALAKP